MHLKKERYENEGIGIFSCSGGDDEFYGVSDSDGEYYFVPSDALQKDIDTLDDPHRKITSLVSWNRFFDTLRGTLGKRILIVDTCESKNIAGTYELYSLIKRSASSNFAIITASKGDEYSQEYAKGGHGLFTYGFLKALEGEGDRNSDGAVSLNEAFDYASETVARLHNRDVGPQTPQISGAASLLNAPFIRVE